MQRTLVLLINYVKRDWLKWLVWTACIVGLSVTAAGKFNSLYAGKSAMDSIVATLKTPAMVSMFGPMTATAPYSSAIIYSMEMMVFMGLFMVMMNIYFAVKNTRSEEESGVLELIRAHAVGKNASLFAVMIELILINLTVGFLLFVGLEMSGIHGSTLVGSLLYGISLAVFGQMFGSISLLIAQLVNNARGATIGSYLVLGILFLSRMITDVNNTSLTWWTIFGWIEKLNIYAQNNWSPLLLMMLVIIVLGVTTIKINSIRDINSGWLSINYQRRYSSRFLNNPFTLLLRLETMPLIIWTLGMFILGVSYGSIFGQVGDLMTTNPMLAKLLGNQAVQDANMTIILRFSGMLAVVFAVISTIPAVQIILKINKDERKGWLELLHANAVSRIKIYLSYGILAAIIAAICLLAGILGMYVSGAATVNYGLDSARFLRSFVAYYPTVLTVLGISMLMVSLVPKFQNLIWIVPSYGFVSIYLGKLLNLPNWSEKLTPYGWVNQVPLKTVDFNLIWICLSVTIILSIISIVAYCKRDLTVN